MKETLFFVTGAIASSLVVCVLIPRLKARARWARLQDLKAGRRPRAWALAWI